MVAVVAYNPDGQVVRARGGRPVGPGVEWFAFAERPKEHRAMLSIQRAWYTRKGRPALPPEGARVHVGEFERQAKPAPGSLIDRRGLVFVGAAAFEYRRVPVIDPETDEVTGTKLDWVDLRLEAQQAAEAKALEDARAAHAQRKARRAAEAALTREAVETIGADKLDRLNSGGEGA